MEIWGRRNSVAVTVVAVGFAAAGLWQAAVGSFFLGVTLLAGGFAVMLPALFRRGVGSVDDAMLVMQFVRNPADTIYDQVDMALDREAEKSARDKDKPNAARVEYHRPETFDADAAFARYMEKRERGDVDIPPPSDTPAVPARAFGRKGL